MTPLTFFDEVGLVGVIITLIAYFLLQIGRTQLRGWFYSALNILGSLLIIISLIKKFNVAAFAMELAWLALSFYGALKSYHDQRRKEEQ